MSEGFKGINVKKTTQGQSRRGEDQFIVNLAPEAVAQLLEKVAALAESERGVKLTFNTSSKEGKFGQFLSTYFYVDEIQAPGTNYGGNQGATRGQGQYSKGTFKPKAKGMSEATKTAAARTLRQDPVE